MSVVRVLGYRRRCVFRGGVERPMSLRQHQFAAAVNHGDVRVEIYAANFCPFGPPAAETFFR